MDLNMRRASTILLAASLAAVSCAGPANEIRQGAWSTKTDSAIQARGEPAPFPLANPIDARASASQLQEPAAALLQQAAASTNPLLRANAIEALHGDRQRVLEVVRVGLADENRGVRFVAVMTVGKLRLSDLAALVQPLLHDESTSVQAAAIFALRRCGVRVDPSPLAIMVLGSDPEAKGNAAYILGELGDRTAIPMLRNAIGRGTAHMVPARRKVVELQIAEALVKLGDADQLEVIRAALFAPPEEGELAAFACQLCGELKDFGALPNLLDLATRTGRRQQSAEVRLAAALAAARIDPTRAPVEVPQAYINAERFEIRAQAAHTLGVMGANGVAGAVPFLARLMQDTNPLVQIAAAGGVIRINGERPVGIAQGLP